MNSIWKRIGNVWDSILEKGTGWIRKNGKKWVIRNLPYFMFGFFCNKVSWIFSQREGRNGWEKIVITCNRMDQIVVSPFLSWKKTDVLIGVFGGIGLWMIVFYRGKHAKKYRHGREYGSARWGTEKDIAPYEDPIFEKNLILTETERLMLSGRPREPKYARNKNVLVIGGSGSGKTRFYVKPNLMQLHSSYVVTDPNR